MEFDALTYLARLNLIDHDHCSMISCDRDKQPLAIQRNLIKGGTFYVRCHVHVDTLGRMWTGLILNSHCTLVCLRVRALELVYDFHNEFSQGSLRPSSSDVLGGKEWKESNQRLWSLGLRCSLPLRKHLLFMNVNELVSHSDQVITHSTSPPPRKKAFNSWIWADNRNTPYLEKNLRRTWEPHLQIHAALCGVILPNWWRRSLSICLYVGSDSPMWFWETYKVPRSNFAGWWIGGRQQKGTNPSSLTLIYEPVSNDWRLLNHASESEAK